jgi:MFS family permease
VKVVLDPTERRSTIALLVTVVTTSMATNAGDVAIGKQVYDITGSALALGLVGLALFAPAALLVLVTGSVADRFDRRRVVTIAAGGEAVTSLGFALYAHTNPTSVVPLFGLVIVFGTFRAFVAPAERSLPADIIGPERLPWLVARYSGAWQVALIFGPVLGGLLYAIAPAWSYVAMAVLLAIGAAAALVVVVPAREPATVPAVPVPATPDNATLEAIIESSERPAPTTESRGTLHEAMEGLRFIRGNPIVLGAISLDLFAVLFGGAVALLPAIATDQLHVGAVGLGVLRAAGGFGAAVTTAGLVWRPVRRHVGKTLLGVVALFGVFTIVLGLTRSFAVALLAMAVLSGADAVSVFIRATLLPIVTPEDRRGRVLAVENVFIGASNELGAFESGVAGEWLGAPGAIVLGGLATLAVAATWWFAFPHLRDVDEFPRPPEPGASP